MGRIEPELLDQALTRNREEERRVLGIVSHIGQKVMDELESFDRFPWPIRAFRMVIGRTPDNSGSAGLNYLLLKLGRQELEALRTEYFILRRAGEKIPLKEE